MLRATIIGVVCLSISCGTLSCGESSEPVSPGKRTVVCPQKVQKLPNANTKASEELAPPDSSGLLICKFGGYGEGATRVARTGQLVDERQMKNGRAIAGLAQALSELPEFTGDRLCALGSGVKYLLVFHFRDEPDNVVLVSEAGCEVVSNGQDSTTYALDRQVRRVLARLLLAESSA